MPELLPVAVVVPLVVPLFEPVLVVEVWFEPEEVLVLVLELPVGELLLHACAAMPRPREETAPRIQANCEDFITLCLSLLSASAPRFG